MMNCLCVFAPTDEELLRYALDGEILPMAAEEHLRHCLICQQRLARYVSTNNFLTQHLYRSQCPDTTTLLEYCQGLLAAHDALAVTKHLAICPLCTSDVSETRQLPGSATLLSASNPHKSLKSQKKFQGKNVSAAAQSIQNAQQYKESSVEVDYEASIWPMRYQANTTQLLLRVSYNQHGGIALAGTLLSICPDKTSGSVQTFAGVKAELYSAMALTELEDCSASKGEQPLEAVEDPLFTALVDEPGTINFPSVPPGKYLLIVHLPDTALVIEDLRIIERDQTRSDYHKDL